MITLLIVDDHPLFRHGLAAALNGDEEMKVVGEASDGVEAVRKATELRPSVVIMDLRMPGGDGVAAAAALREAAPESKVIVLTASEEDDDLLDAMRVGAKAYLLKYVDPDELVAAIKMVAFGDVIISPAMAVKLVGHLGSGKGHAADGGKETLSFRELEVLRQVATGAGNREIAAQLTISESTIKAHLRSIMEKLEVNNRAQAVAKALNGGLLER